MKFFRDIIEFTAWILSFQYSYTMENDYDTFCERYEGGDVVLSYDTQFPVSNYPGIRWEDAGDGFGDPVSTLNSSVRVMRVTIPLLSPILQVKAGEVLPISPYNTDCDVWKERRGEDWVVVHYHVSLPPILTNEANHVLLSAFDNEEKRAVLHSFLSAYADSCLVTSDLGIVLRSPLSTAPYLIMGFDGLVLFPSIKDRSFFNIYSNDWQGAPPVLFRLDIDAQPILFEIMVGTIQIRSDSYSLIMGIEFAHSNFEMLDSAIRTILQEGENPAEIRNSVNTFLRVEKYKNHDVDMLFG